MLKGGGVRLLHFTVIIIIGLLSARQFFQMKFVDKIVELPKISIRDLENRVRSTHSPLSPPLTSITSPLAQIIAKSQSIVNELKVTSPFYNRQEIEGEKCQCQYHRMKRAKGSLARFRSKHHDRSGNLIEGCNSNQECSYLNEVERMASRVIHNQSSMVLEELCSRNCSRFAKNGRNQQKNLIVKQITKQNKKQIDLPLLVHLSREQLHWQWKLGEVNPKVDIMNKNYISIINNRFSNDKFKSKYLKMLFGFIKMKSNQDKRYIYQSKPYLKNTLNVLLNHFTLDQLKHHDSLSADQIEKIAYFMACKPQKVSGILHDLARVVDQMEGYLNYLRKTQQEKDSTDLIKPEDRYATTGNAQQYEHSQDRTSRIARISLLNKEIASLQKSQNSFATEQRLSTNKIFPMRKSHRPQDQSMAQSSKRVITTQNSDEVDQDREMLVRPHLNISRHLGKGSKTQSPRSTVSVSKDQRQMGKTRESKFGLQGKSKNKQKQRKAQFRQKLVFWDSLDKYKDIKFQEYCSKQEFTTLIQQIERLDRNDEQRAQAAFNKLKVYKMIDSPNRIHSLLQEFKPLIHDGIRERLIKQVVMVRDQRYIEKLMRQLDQAINDVKRTDPRSLDTEEIFPYKEDPTLKQPHHLRNIEYKGHTGSQQRQNDRIIYYEAEEKVVRHLTRQSNQRMELQQAALSEIRAEDIQQNYTKSVNYCVPLTQKQVVVRHLGLERSQQKKILQYMHHHYPNTFHYLNDSINQICSHLPHQGLPPRA